VHKRSRRIDLSVGLSVERGGGQVSPNRTHSLPLCSQGGAEVVTGKPVVSLGLADGRVPGLVVDLTVGLADFLRGAGYPDGIGGLRHRRHAKQCD
jgi:hypothetical protein